MRPHRIVVWMLVLLLGAAPLTPLRAGAEPSVPTFGHPFSSRTTAGERFVGTFDWDRAGFAQDEAGHLVALGVVRSTTPTVKEEHVAAPVKIVLATCDVLRLELGPIPQLGLLDPFHVVLQEATDELDRGEHCAIASAAASGNTAQLVSLLNQEARFGPGSTERNSCPWYEWLECAAVITLCAASCIVIEEACIECFIELGAQSCEACVTP